jgi:hypothetical protein
MEQFEPTFVVIKQVWRYAAFRCMPTSSVCEVHQYIPDCCYRSPETQHQYMLADTLPNAIERDDIAAAL